MPNFALKIAYDGGSFFGWQKTCCGPSIESTLTGVLTQIAQEPFVLQAASRTDRGVHAEAQWVNIHLTKDYCLDKLHKSINALLPSSVRLIHICKTAEHFHPTLHAELKEYHYHLCVGRIQLPNRRNYSWHVPYPLNMTHMQQAVGHFLGEHDFSALCNFRKNLNYADKIRFIEDIQLVKNQEELVIVVKGKSFLYKMVRNIAGLLVYVGRGKISASMVPHILSSQRRELAGITAPAHGLTLKKIYYPQEFQLDL